MTKHIAISLITIVVGFGLMYWSGLISETTSDNWQGIAGITISCVGGVILIVPFIIKAIKKFIYSSL